MLIIFSERSTSSRCSWAVHGRTQPTPTKMKTDKRQISPGVDDDDAHGHHDTLSYFFSKVDAGTCSPSTIRSRQVDRDKIVVEPMWMHFEQDSHVVSEGLEAPPTQSLKLPKQPADPPRTMYTKSSGRFRKIIRTSPQASATWLGCTTRKDATIKPNRYSSKH